MGVSLVSSQAYFSRYTSVISLEKDQGVQIHNDSKTNSSKEGTILAKLKLINNKCNIHLFILYPLQSVLQAALSIFIFYEIYALWIANIDRRSNEIFKPY